MDMKSSIVMKVAIRLICLELTAIVKLVKDAMDCINLALKVELML